MDDSESSPHDPGDDIVWHDQTVSRETRETRLCQQACVLWFTGLSGCGKSTIANRLDQKLVARGAVTYLLDGDNIRHGLCAPPQRLAKDHDLAFAERFGLGFGSQDREENIRRIGSVAALFVQAGLVTLTAFVSPYRRDRDRVRTLIEQAGRPGDFLEIFVDTPLEICEARDPKGLYKKARAGEIPHFTGVSDSYEPPLQPEIRLDGGRGRSPDALADEVLALLHERQVLKE